jgi:hypothetical protein
MDVARGRTVDHVFVAETLDFKIAAGARGLDGWADRWRTEARRPPRRHRSKGGLRKGLDRQGSQNPKKTVGQTARANPGRETQNPAKPGPRTHPTAGIGFKSRHPSFQPGRIPHRVVPAGVVPPGHQSALAGETHQTMHD